MDDALEARAEPFAIMMLVNVLGSVDQFQRDLQNELTRDGLAAAWAAGAKSGRRPRLAQLGLTGPGPRQPGRS